MSIIAFATALPLALHGWHCLTLQPISCGYRPMMHLSDTYIAMPVVVHELVEHAVDPELINQPRLLDQRCCLYRLLVPPDKLNPQVSLPLQSA